MKKILIVDDSKKTRLVLKLILTDYTILEAENGLDGIQQYERFHPNIVLMDLQMPVMDGINASEKILQLDGSAKIIILTAIHSAENSEILALGVKRLLEKPVRKSILCSVVQELIA